ncbi:MAG: LysR family transcriptional regulator [Gammaproteobacteria bacterium]|nr:LysR family transcriptional regulator [Gammaproteobacteria bacterium]
MNKLKRMRTFMLIAEQGSIVRAANSLGITKAAASKQLIDLENYFQKQLFQRTTRELKLTATGHLFYEALKKVFTALKDAEYVIMQNQEKPIGNLRITSHRNFGEKYILNHLKEFITLYPDIKIDLELADRFPDLEKENIDLLCGVSHDGPEHLVRKKLISAHHIFCASPHYLETFGIPIKPKDLLKHRYITHSFRKKEDVFLFPDRTLKMDYFMRLNDSPSMVKCALQGLGFIKIFNYIAEEYLKSGELIEILKNYREPKKSIYIFYQQHKFMPLKIRVFLDFLYQKISPSYSGP